jgi:uncharacterized protein YwgA
MPKETKGVANITSELIGSGTTKHQKMPLMKKLIFRCKYKFNSNGAYASGLSNILKEYC